MKKKTLARLFIIYLPVLIFFIFTIFPFVWTLITSLKPSKELFTSDIKILPVAPTVQNYLDLFANTDFLQNMINSFIVAFSTCVVSLIISLLASYAFSRYSFKGKYFFMTTFLIINMFPAVLLLIPLYSIFRQVGLLHTYGALVIAYSTFTIPFSVWLLTGYLNGLPISLEEAALIDGCNRFQSFTRVILPLTIPGIISTGIYIFITAWNEFTFAVMLTNQATRTIPVALQAFNGEYVIQWGLLTAGGVLTSIPIVLIFLFVQKRLVQGLTAGAVKG
jgi:multiple sugar transport system permease protein